MDGVREYRGGVLYLASGVGGNALGARPNSLRWAGVRGMSDSSSFFRIRGRQAMMMLARGHSCKANHAQPTYMRNGEGALRSQQQMRWQDLSAASLRLLAIIESCEGA